MAIEGRRGIEQKVVVLLCSNKRDGKGLKFGLWCAVQLSSRQYRQNEGEREGIK